MKEAIKWMATNHVAANILLIIIVFLGILKGTSIKQEAMPDVEIDQISLSATYEGAGPNEVATQVCRPIESAVVEVDGIEEITCSASEGSASLRVKLEDDVDAQIALEEIRNAVIAISDLPDEVDTPSVSQVKFRRELIELAIYGDVPEDSLFQYAFEIKDELLKVDGINYISVSGTRPTEILIEIPPATLTRYNLTLSSVAALILKESKNYPSGSVKKGNGQISFRTISEKTKSSDFENIPIKQFDDGTALFLRDIAVIRQTLQESDNYTRYDGVPAVILNIYQSDAYTPKSLSTAVSRELEQIMRYLPTALNFEIWQDSSEIFQSRFDLLIGNARLGIILVFVLLAFFLEFRLAFWVMIGIPVSFIGALFFLPYADVTINMNSMFAFILVSGIVVDDAIVVGENIYRKREEGLSAIQASIQGCLEMAGPVIFAVLTTICAFAPLMAVGGFMGHFAGSIPVVVIAVIGISLIEALFILPAHLASTPKREAKGIYRFTKFLPFLFDKVLKFVIHKPFRKVVVFSIKNRYSVIAVSVTLMLLSIGVIMGGIVPLSFFPSIQDQTVTATIQLPNGYPVAKSRKLSQQIEDAGKRIVQEADRQADNGITSMDGMFTSVSSKTRRSRSQNTTIRVYLRLQEDETKRNITASQLSSLWRQKIPKSPDILSISFASRMMHFGDDISIGLSHSNLDDLKNAVNDLKVHLTEYDGVKDISDSEADENAEYSFHLSPEAKSIGLTPSGLASQLKAAFQGIDLFSIPRNTEDVDVVILFPIDDRENINTLEQMEIYNSNQSIPLKEAIIIQEGTEPKTIRRVDMERIVQVTAKIDEKVKNTDDIMTTILANYVPILKSHYPGLSVKISGMRESRNESMRELMIAFGVALAAIYALLAVFFKSYTQPIIVMIAIPFGIAGAVGGHMLMGHAVSFMSLFGLIGLSGVVVNDSLILISTINRLIKEGRELKTAVIDATLLRFRPIILTSLTTFIGLTPILFEDSVDAQFLIPTAISLGMGIMFATVIILIIVPALFLIFKDIGKVMGYGNQQSNHVISNET